MPADAYTQQQGMMGQLAAQQEQESGTISKACLLTDRIICCREEAAVAEAVRLVDAATQKKGMVAQLLGQSSKQSE